VYTTAAVHPEFATMTSLVVSICLVGIAQPPEQLPAPAPTAPAPVSPPAQLLVPAAPPTLKEFARDFKPHAGLFDVTVIHPVTGRPVNVAFKLPEGAPRVTCGKRSIEFSYGGCNVEIVFRLGGRVGVEYRN
jgi:hypothetical protein